MQLRINDKILLCDKFCELWHWYIVAVLFITVVNGAGARYELKYRSERKTTSHADGITKQRRRRQE